MSDDHQTVEKIAPLIPFILVAATQVKDAFAFTVLAVMAVMTTVLVLFCWRRDANHCWASTEGESNA